MMNDNPLFELKPQEEMFGIAPTTTNCYLGILKDNDSGANNWIISPDMVSKLTENHISVLMQRGTGEKWGFQDLDYADEGAELFDDIGSVIQTANIVVKTTNFTSQELSLMKEGQTLISCVDFNTMTCSDAEIMEKTKINALAFNLITDRDGHLILENMQKNILGEKARQISFAEFLIPILIVLMFNRIRFAVQTNPAILQSIYCYNGILTHREFAEKHHLKWQDILLLCWNWN